MATAVSDICPGQWVDVTLACLSKDRLFSKETHYMVLLLRDPSGTIEGRVFRELERIEGSFEKGDVVRVLGRAKEFRGRVQIDVADVEKVTGTDPARFLPAAMRDIDELDGFLEHLAAEVHDPPLAELMATLLGDTEIREEWRRAPCTARGHHAYTGGLLEHTVAVATLAQETCQLHGGLDPDLLLSAALIHDLGKTREFTYGAEFGLTEHGRLLGHLQLGQQLIYERAKNIVPEPRLAALLHCILSHHGPATPGNAGGGFLSREAVALHRLNQLDAGLRGRIEDAVRPEYAAA